jgi:hypothetical protein
MVGAEGDRRKFWRNAVIWLVGLGIALAIAIVPHIGDSDRAWVESGATSDVTCGDINAFEVNGFEAKYALATKVTEELHLPKEVDREYAVTEVEAAIYDACANAYPEEHPVDSDFKGSLKTKLTRPR